MGWRGNHLLLQGEVEEYFEQGLHGESVSHSTREVRTGKDDRPDCNTSKQLVQEQEAAGASCRNEEGVSIFQLVVALSVITSCPIQAFCEHS